MEMFNQKKVFIVLDDVNNFLQSETLVERLRPCGLGSRIIITSRDKQVLCNFNVDDHEIYEGEGLDNDEALELFRGYANPTEDCMALSKKIVNYAKGNPLALKVLASSLKGKSKQVWESALNNLLGIVNSEIFDVLKISYDGLNEEEKKLFLDLACFLDLYNDEYDILEEELLYCEYSLSVLIAKSLVTIDEEGVEMHDLLQEMGREIVRRESPKIPGKRIRLWEQDDVIQILKNNTGTDAVEMISLDMNGLEDEDIDSNSSLDMDGLEDEGIDLSPQVFDNMHNLRFLLFDGPNKVHLSKGLNCLPNKLMVLHWPGYPLKALPSNFNPKQLVKLDLSGSNIEQFWEGTKHTPKFPKLKWLILSDCQCLSRIPNLSDFPMLVEVDLTNCESLVGLTSSVHQLNNLQDVNLSGCINVTKFPLISGSIERLNLSETAIEEVPSSIQSLTNLTELQLLGCKRLNHISTSICKLKSLSTLNLRYCSQLETFPEISETMEFLEDLDLSGSAIKVLPLSIEHLNGLQRLTLFNCKNLNELHTSIEHLNGLQYLTLDGCKNLEMLPCSICNLTSLEDLNLSYCSKLDKLPDNLGNLKSLKSLYVRGFAVGQLPSSITCLENLVFLDCSGCSLMEIPEDIGCLSSLEELKLSRNMFESLPKSIKQLSKLESLSLSHCKMLRSIPELPEGLEYLEAMDCDQLCQLPDASEFVRCIKSKSHFHSVDFIFTNSLNMIKAVINVFEESLRIMQCTEKESRIPSNAFSIYVPGNKIPEWFSYQSPESSSVNIRVLQNDLFNRKFMGFAICADLGFEEYYGRRLDYCEFYCDFEIYHDHIKIGKGSQYYLLNRARNLSLFMDSKHLLLGYCSFSSFYSSFQNPNKLPISDSDCLDISIELKFKYNCHRPKRFAVHLIDAEEPIEISGATVQEIGETSGRRIDRSDDNDEEVEPYPKRICTQAIKTLDLFH